MKTIGLQTHIWNNNLKSGLLLAVYPLVILGLVWACAFVLGVAQYGDEYRGMHYAGDILTAFWPAILTVIALWFMISYFFHTRMIRALSHSRPVTRTEEPTLYNLLENLCIAEGLPMPRLEIIETDALNAFASGINKNSYTITVTRGLLDALEKDELEGVLAHELTHILNRDVRLLMVTIIFTGMVGFAAQMVWMQIRYGFLFSGGRDRDRKNNSLLVLLAIGVILWIGYMATLFMRFALSRRREYMADAGAVQMTKNPEGMMRALMRISGHERLPQSTEDIAMMCIENTVPFMGLFATHPKIEDRIAALSAVTNTPVPDLAPEKGTFQSPWHGR